MATTKAVELRKIIGRHRNHSRVSDKEPATMTEWHEVNPMNPSSSSTSRRDFLRAATAAGLASTLAPAARAFDQQNGIQLPEVKAPWDMSQGRPKPEERKFQSTAVEAFLKERSARIADP
jgi:hypothetical protein